MAITDDDINHSDHPTIQLTHEDYTMGWICALPKELTAAAAMLEETHADLPRQPNDHNSYTLGRVGGHNVVVACLPKGEIGNNNSATVATRIMSTFPSIKFGLMVGIGGGVPIAVRLGDVVVSTPADGFPGVVQWDFGKTHAGGNFKRTGSLNRPPTELLTALTKLENYHEMKGSKIPNYLEELAQNWPRLRSKYTKSERLKDVLFSADYDHVELPSICSTGAAVSMATDVYDEEQQGQCIHCDESKIIKRRPRDMRVHYGLIASGNRVIKDATFRDEINKSLEGKVLCFEMEAAGLMNDFPCIVIRGICDYADSHKNKAWQEYAAALAAAFAKELLFMIPSQEVSQMPVFKRGIEAIRSDIQDLKMSLSIGSDEEKCFQSLFVTDAIQDRDNIIDAKGEICPGTCHWITSTKEFKQWNDTLPHLLWISAPPGIGKTYMSIYLSRHFESLARQKAQGTLQTLFFFCDNKVETRNTAVNILRGLMCQLVQQQRDLLSVVVKEWKIQPDIIFKNKSLNALWRIFQRMVTTSKATTINCVIDALDECEEQSLSSLLRKFEILATDSSSSSTKLRLICLSRRYPERIPEALSSFVKIELDMIPAGKEDIRLFISQCVSKLAQKKGISNSKLEDHITKTFLQRAEDTFLWVSFMVQDLEKKNVDQIEASLNQLPQGLDAVYERIILQIRHDEKQNVGKILDLILVAARPLRVPEICEAIDLPATEYVKREEVCLSWIRSCGHLLQVAFSNDKLWYSENDRGIASDYDTDVACRTSDHGAVDMPDYWQMQVTFLHQSAKDYIVKQKQNCGSLDRLQGAITNRLLAYICRGSLLADIYASLIQKPYGEPRWSRDVIIKFPLANYTTIYWPCHFQELQKVDEIIKRNGIFFCQGF